MSATLTPVCPACGRDVWRPSLDAGEYKLVRCRCGLRALDGASADDAAVLNESMYGGEEYNAWYRSVEGALRNRYQRDCAEIERLVPEQGRILDVGCSYGWFLSVAKERGWRAFGVEVTPQTALQARASGLDVPCGSLFEAAFADEAFNVVCLWDVLEHVVDVDSFLAECHRILKPGGVLALQSPNIRSVMARQAGSKWDWLLLPQHVWHFTPRSIKETLERRGFEIERRYTWEPSEALIQNWAFYRRHPRIAASRSVRRITDRLVLGAGKVWCKAGYGGLLRVYARRLP